MNLIVPALAERSAMLASPSLPAAPERAAAILHAARLLLPALERGQALDAAILRAAMEAAFGTTDAAGTWVWKDAYEACEAAQVVFLRRQPDGDARHAGEAGRAPVRAAADGRRGGWRTPDRAQRVQTRMRAWPTARPARGR